MILNKNESHILARLLTGNSNGTRSEKALLRKIIRNINPSATLTSQEAKLELTREQCRVLYEYELKTAFLNRDHYEELQPIVAAIGRFADNGIIDG